MPAMPASIRSVEVHPPSRTREVRTLFRTLAAIVFGALLVIGLRWQAGRAAGADLMPFQRLFASVDPGLQRAYRELQEGLIEAENARAETRAWPAPAALAEQGVPPFAPDPTRKERYAWSLTRDGLNVSYRGIPERDGAPELLAWIQEPVPGTGEVLDPKAPLDEI